MTKEELKQKAELFIESHKENKYMFDISLVDLLTLFATETTKELEEKLEQTEKDLADYQFNYPKIKELEKENAELKARLQKKINTTTVSDYPYSALKLEEAKNILQLFLDADNNSDMLNAQMKAEQFLKEVETQEDRLCEFCDYYKSCPDGKRCLTCDNGSKWKRR